jgi:hypothetical protein
VWRLHLLPAGVVRCRARLSPFDYRSLTLHCYCDVTLCPSKGAIKFFSKNWHWGITETQRHRRTSAIDTFSEDKVKQADGDVFAGVKTNDPRMSVGTAINRQVSVERDRADAKTGWADGAGPDNL